MYKLKDGIYMETLEDGAVLLDTISERIVVLADEEKNILDAILNRESGDVVKQMLEKYDGERNIIEQDINSFIEKLKENNFIESYNG